MKINITSKKGSYNVTELVPSARWSGDYRQAARSLEFYILSSPSDKSIPVVDCPLGAHVQLFEGSKLLLDGFIDSRTKNTEQSQIAIHCFDRGFYLKRNKTSHIYAGETAATPEQITAQVAGEFGIAVGTLAATGVKVERNFFGVTVYDIIATAYTLAARTTKKQYHIGFTGAKLCVTEIGAGGKSIIIKGKSNLISANTTESIENMVNTVAIYDANGKFVRKVEDAAAITAYGTLQEVLKQSATDDQSAAAQTLITERGVSQKITVDCLGDINNITGGTVVMQEPYTGLSGLFYIENDLHEWKRGQYYNKLTLNFKKMSDEKEAGSAPKT